ncbi:helix-turn-helix transcriptional regulator [Flavobacterium sp. GA093]|uniref:Helix-turn-helix transcriptional regulator n=1 Tax=Flavobacterium hydrocarbonoxydans TaxID=2683249 RepID=A0A6I4NPX1_9FLAO|nr:LuxR C-terminal-related transcriptional regulator [Flavobacterium hydrocarbonoxydans]MWB96300.1 helix-turn-helix transcriptional regulator [Flavobacterium hydrocarbonoxydans]
MLPEIQNLHNVWFSNRTVKTTAPSNQVSFDELTNSIISTGPFSFYIIDFFDMSLSNISPSLSEMHGFDPEKVTFNDVLGAIHPDDIEFVVKAEAFLTRFFYENVGREKLLTYKISYCHRARLHDGEYALFNHQALMLTMDDAGGYGKSLNIHTRIDHLTNLNTYKISLIGLNGEPSFINLSLDENDQNFKEFSKREIDIIKLIANGLSNAEIAEELFISALTVNKHRNNILAKSDSKNTAQLVKKCILQGLI